VNAQCDKLLTVVGRQFITLSIHLCKQHSGQSVNVFEWRNFIASVNYMQYYVWSVFLPMLYVLYKADLRTLSTRWA